jgi:hypothetical protein
MKRPPGSRRATAVDWSPARLQLNLLRHLERVVDLDAEVSDRALKLSVAEEKLAGAKVAGLLVDQRDLRSA